MNLLLRAGAKIFRALIRMVRHFSLAHLLADLRHKSAVDLSSELARLIAFAELLLRAGILPLHIIQNVSEHRFRAHLLAMFSAIFAAVHLALVLGDDRLRIRVALASKSRSGHVVIHERAIAAQMTSP